jgi:DNA invertase Pin-like site-specific DNA recombinase
VLVVWAVERLCRHGIEELLRLIRELRERDVSLVSHHEPWLNGFDATTELPAAVAAWVARQESVRRSERIRAGLARRGAQGQADGRCRLQAREKDERPRRTEGYRQATSVRADEIAFRESDRPNPPTAGDTYGDAAMPRAGLRPSASHDRVRQERVC